MTTTSIPRVERQREERLLLELRLAVKVGALLYAPCHVPPAILDLIYFPHPVTSLLVRSVSIAAVYLLVFVTGRVRTPRHVLLLNAAAYLVVLAPALYTAVVMPATIINGFLPSLIALAIFMPGRFLHHLGLVAASTLALFVGLGLRADGLSRIGTDGLPAGYLFAAVVQIAVIAAGGSFLFTRSRKEAARWQAMLERIEALFRLGNELSSAGILRPDEAVRLRDEIVSRRGASTKSIVETLLAEKRITSYQAERILEGRLPSLRIGNYLVLAQEGAGGMGRVFQVRRIDTGSVAALKQLLPETVRNPQAIARFRHEVETTRTLVHPHIVRTEDVFLHEELPCLVMEWMDGGTVFRSTPPESPLPVRIAYEVARQIGSALDYAHGRGIVHRDVKPENILMTRSGVAKLTDFGIAQVRESEELTALTRTGLLLGTVDYMAPEQAVDPSGTDIRADLYSLGCTLYRLLAGRVPFDGDTTLRKLFAHQNQAPIPLRNLNAAVPGSLAEIVERLMAKRPADRFQTPAELLSALASISSDVFHGLSEAEPLRRER